jgi:cyclophilin family peptidyl-prolyl cis-trans isomerase
MNKLLFVGFVFAALLPAQETKAAAPAKREPGLYARIATSMGDITLQLFEKETPITVKNFVELATGARAYVDPRNGLPSKLPLYNGLTFHRVIPKFMIQGGDPLADGTGGTKNIPDEIVPSLKFDRPGRLGMANAGPGTGSCQFFITEVEAPHLDGLHTIFGQVVEGLELVAKIGSVPTENDRPLTPVIIQSVTIERVN